ncbi:hypothetical protein [Vibrio europaeus]|uniref:hypothetical protein n=1 Tax=Vibrio europaeus TaxID=300876 RepID=UPI00233F2127|nr:hypothetical protein [Vibrio europaeus]MDC5753550.1 hypothetical protein [Vibrio europaeus]MDC5816538.1 hypothetical protein [Vibrio europaeus]
MTNAAQSPNEELTPRQKYQREYYASNKEKICADKRAKYANGNKSKRKPLGAVIPTPPAKATSPVIHVDKMPVKPRHSVEDIELARELGITVEELLS